MSTTLDLIFLHRALQYPRDTPTHIELTINIYSSENGLRESSEKSGTVLWVQGIVNDFWTVMSMALKLMSLHQALRSPRDTCAKIELTIKTTDQKTIWGRAVKKIQKILWVHGIANSFWMVNGVEIVFAASGNSISTWHSCKNGTHCKSSLLR